MEVMIDKKGDYICAKCKNKINLPSEQKIVALEAEGIKKCICAKCFNWEHELSEVK